MSILTPYLTNSVSLIVTGALVYRQLRTQTIEREALWIRPALFGALALALTVASACLSVGHVSLLGMCVAVGALIGGGVGLAIVRATLARSAVRFGALTVGPSVPAAAIWLVTLALGLGARALVGSSLPLLYLDINVAVLTVVAAAATVIASSYRRAIDAAAMLQRA